MISEGKIDGEMDRKIQNSSKSYEIMEGILWNREIPQ
jgi:hypothetical protein